MAKGGSRWRPQRYGKSFSSDGSENLRFGRVRLRVDQGKVRAALAEQTSAGAGSGESLQEYLSRFRGGINVDGIVAYREKAHATNAPTTRLPTGQELLGSEAAFTKLRTEMRNREQDVLLYVHGYNVDWEEAVAGAGALQIMLNRGRSKPVLVVLFSWPSDGSVMPWAAYRSDRADAEASGKALARAALKFRDFIRSLTKEDQCDRKVHLLCHSMGNYVLQNALPRIAQFSEGRLPRLVDNVFLCAADVDDDIFERGEAFERLHAFAGGVHIYHNDEDTALAISDYTKGNPDRLGEGGAARPAHLHRRVQQVDCKGLVSGFVEHSYYLDGRVNRDIRQSIDGVPRDDPSRSRAPGGQPNTWVLV